MMLELYWTAVCVVEHEDEGDGWRCPPARRRWM